MTVINTQNNLGNLDIRGNRADAFGYDLAEEKKRIALGVEELKKEIKEEWEKKYANAEVFPARVAAMHPEVVDFLLGFNLVSVYDNIAKQANLDEKGRNALPQVAWQVAQEKKWDSLDQVLESKIPLVHSAHVTVAQMLEQNIISKIRPLAEKPFEKKENGSAKTEQKIQLPLAKAIEQYPKLGEQGITVNPLKLKYFEMPMRPSIKNWITDFHDNMGAGKHGAIDRGNYLYHGENGKKLTPLERQKLSSILKSLDENSPITVDPEKQIVVFENNKTSTISQFHVAERSFPPVENNKQSAPNHQTDVSASRGSQSVTNSTNSNEQRDVFERYTPDLQKSSQRTVTKAELESDNYFGNFSSNAAKQVPLPTHIPESDLIAAAPKNRNISSKPAETKDAPSFGGNISFSSAQKFSKERKTIQSSRWHIKPTGNFSDGSDAIEDKMNQAMKNSKNVVDLKN